MTVVILHDRASVLRILSLQHVVANGHHPGHTVSRFILKKISTLQVVKFTNKAATGKGYVVTVQSFNENQSIIE